MHVELKSKLIEAADYDPGDQILRIHFTNGERREFGEVPKSVFDELASAKSPGHFYFDNIRHHFTLKE